MFRSFETQDEKNIATLKEEQIIITQELQGHKVAHTDLRTRPNCPVCNALVLQHQRISQRVQALRTS